VPIDVAKISLCPEQRSPMAKAQLDVFIRANGERLSVANDELGIRRLLGRLGPADFVILESDWWP
jgi:hypothetical protein